MTGTVEEKRNATVATMAAAWAWWDMKRPVDFDLQQHLDNPTVNTTTDAETELAKAVAAAVKIGAL